MLNKIFNNQIGDYCLFLNQGNDLVFPWCEISEVNSQLVELDDQQF